MWIKPLSEPFHITVPGFIGKLIVASTLKTELGPVLRLLLKGASQQVATKSIVEVTGLSEGVIREQADWLVRRGMLSETEGNYDLTKGGVDLFERLLTSERLDSGYWSIFYNRWTKRLCFTNGLESASNVTFRLTPSLYQGDNPLNALELVYSTKPPDEVVEQFEAEQLLLKLFFERGTITMGKPYILRAIPTYYNDFFNSIDLIETNTTMDNGPFIEVNYPFRVIQLEEPLMFKNISEQEWEKLEILHEERPDWLSDKAKLLLKKRNHYLKFKDYKLYVDEATGSYSDSAPEESDEPSDILGMNFSEELLQQFTTLLISKGYDMSLFNYVHRTFSSVKRIPVSWLEEVNYESRT